METAQMAKDEATWIDRIISILSLLTIPAIVVILILGYLDHREANDHATKQAKINAANITKINHVLTQVCRTNSDIVGALTATAYWLSFDQTSRTHQGLAEALGTYAKRVLERDPCKPLRKP